MPVSALTNQRAHTLLFFIRFSWLIGKLQWSEIRVPQLFRQVYIGPIAKCRSRYGCLILPGKPRVPVLRAGARYCKLRAARSGAKGSANCLKCALAGLVGTPLAGDYARMRARAGTTSVGVSA